MAFIIKCNALHPVAAETVEAVVPPYQGAQPAAGNVVFLWTCETRGGEGLAGRGLVAAVTAEEGKKLRLTIRLDGDAPARHLGKSDLQPLRDSQAPTPAASLAKKLYKHSLQKVVTLDPEEERFLGSHFLHSLPVA